MTDAEIIRLCAEAMETPPDVSAMQSAGPPRAPWETPPDIPGVSAIWNVGITYEGEERKVSTAVSQFYDPLHNDAQAMALVKRFRLAIGNDEDLWYVFPGHPFNEVDDNNLNRAICKCVAHMRTEKNKNRLQPGTS